MNVKAVSGKSKDHFRQPPLSVCKAAWPRSLSGTPLPLRSSRGNEAQISPSFGAPTAASQSLFTGALPEQAKAQEVGSALRCAPLEVANTRAVRTFSAARGAHGVCALPVKPFGQHALKVLSARSHDRCHLYGGKSYTSSQREGVECPKHPSPGLRVRSSQNRRADRQPRDPAPSPKSQFAPGLPREEVRRRVLPSPTACG